MPQFEFPWRQDREGEYLKILSDEVPVIELRPQTTSIFVFVGKWALYDHIWVEMPELGETDETVMGCRIWQRSIDNKLGDGAFDSLTDQMHEKGFYTSGDTEPSELDIQAFHNSFPGVPSPEENDIDVIVRNETKNITAALAYYLSEWTEQYGA